MRELVLSKRAEVYRRLHKVVRQYDSRLNKDLKWLTIELDGALVDLIPDANTRCEVVDLLSYYIATSDTIDFFAAVMWIGAIVDDEEVRRGLADFMEFLYDRNARVWDYWDEDCEWGW